MADPPEDDSGRKRKVCQVLTARGGGSVSPLPWIDGFYEDCTMKKNDPNWVPPQHMTVEQAIEMLRAVALGKRGITRKGAERIAYLLDRQRTW